MGVHEKPYVLLIQVITKQQKPADVQNELAETELLVDTFGGKVVDQLVQRRPHPDPNFYIGSGKVGELKELVDKKEIDIVIINGQVKTGQLFRIEKELWEVDTSIKVWDRIDLILNIFDQHASTVEAQLQIKLARAKHQGPRIYGLGKTELSRQGGGVGTRGKGETNIEFERRQIKADQQRIEKELKKVLKQKHERLRKRNELGIGPVALVGYTSAGKTTLFNTITGKEKEMNKGLFTTLDTVVGKLKTSYFEQPILISDTIGFIHNLPPVLIESFKSTLYESLEAELLLHVVDAHDEQVIEKIAVVEDILDELGATQPRILLLNKSDLLSDEQQSEILEKVTTWFAERDEPLTQKIMFVSAQTEAGIDLLKSELVAFFSDGSDIKDDKLATPERTSSKS